MPRDDASTRRRRRATELVKGGLLRSDKAETSAAIYLTSGYVYASPEEAEASFKGDIERFIYSRYSNPTVSIFEERLRLLEGAEACRATASGMSAVFTALLARLKAGDRVVASRALFGSCRYIVADLLPRFGIESELVDGTDLSAWQGALDCGAQAIFLETPSNPTLEVIDIRSVCDLAHAAGAIVIVDNVFATPLLQRPLELGADVVVYSATKHIDGQGRALGGAILCSTEFLTDHLQPLYRHTGPSMSPFNAWCMLKGLETLEVRVERHCANALAVARYLENRPDVRRVYYPALDSHPQSEIARRQMAGGSSLVTFELEGGRNRAFEFMKKLQLVDISNNLGDTKSLITHPATTTHHRFSGEVRVELGITDSLLRLSVGLEDPEDILEDLEQALA